MGEEDMLKLERLELRVQWSLPGVPTGNALISNLSKRLLLTCYSAGPYHLGLTDPDRGVALPDL